MEPVATISSTSTSRFAWEDGFPRGNYRDLVTGRFVSWETIRGGLDETLDSAGQTVRTLSEQLQARRIPLAEWQRGMEREIKSIHLASYALQRGGIQNLSPSDYGQIGNLLFNPNGSIERGTIGQYGFLRRFAEQIERGLPLDGNFIRRADQYVKAGRQTFHTAETRQMQAAGFTEERFILHPADHCTDADGPRGGCVERAEAGWNPIGTFPGIGDVNCYMNDKCSKEFRNAAGLVWPSR